MQLSALDRNKDLVYADGALSGVDYFCRGCGDTVRVRGGRHRRQHFFHPHGPHPCAQTGKGLRHLQVQWYLAERLSGAQLEVAFPEVRRIADVVWPDQSLVFEVQCSPISLLEVMERNRDYQSQGFQVVWILHDQRYNQRRCSEAEEHLRSCGCLFTNIDVEGQGEIYDQWDFVRGGLRWAKRGPWRVDVGEVRARGEKVMGLPNSLARRQIPVFGGDGVDRASRDRELAAEWRDLEAELNRRSRRHDRWWFRVLKEVRFFFVAVYRCLVESHAD